MMTIRKAQVITGYEVRVRTNGIHPGGPRFYAEAFDKYGNPAGFGHGVSEKRALQSLVDQVYEHRRQLIAYRQNYRCGHCGRVRPLSCHHESSRAHGRVDAITNMIALCADCHRRQHEESKKILVVDRH